MDHSEGGSSALRPVNRLAALIEWLTDNPVLSLSKGAAPLLPATPGALRATSASSCAPPRSAARSLTAWPRPRRTLKRDYVRVNPTPDARTVIEQLPTWLTHYNEVHPHKTLGYRSPCEYIMQAREAPAGIQGVTTSRSVQARCLVPFRGPVPNHEAKL